MRVPMKWLGRYVDISDVTPEQLQQMLDAVHGGR